MNELDYILWTATAVASAITIIKLLPSWSTIVIFGLGSISALFFFNINIPVSALFMVGLQASFFAGHILWYFGKKKSANTFRSIVLAILLYSALRASMNSVEVFFLLSFAVAIVIGMLALTFEHAFSRKYKP